MLICLETKKRSTGRCKLHTCNPRQVGRKTYLSTAGSDAHKRSVVPHFCKELAMKLRDRRREHCSGFVSSSSWQIPKEKKERKEKLRQKRGCCGLSSEQEAKCNLKITLGKEQNMHRGSETKFPWWYFLHTGDSGWPMRGCFQERAAATVCTNTSPSHSSPPPSSNPSLLHSHTHLPPLTY